MNEGKDGYFDFDMHSVNVALVNEVRDLQAENEQLKNENEKLGTRLEKIERVVGISASK